MHLRKRVLSELKYSGYQNPEMNLGAVTQKPKLKQTKYRKRYCIFTKLHSLKKLFLVTIQFKTNVRLFKRALIQFKIPYSSKKIFVMHTNKILTYRASLISSLVLFSVKRLKRLFDVRKKRTKLPEIGGLAILGNARKKTTFFYRRLSLVRQANESVWQTKCRMVDIGKPR